MEATMSTGINYTYNQVELNKVINNTIDVINNVVKKNNYQVLGKIEYYNLPKRELSKNEMKKIQKYCFWITGKPTLRRINTFFGILSNTYGVGRVKIKVSLKEERIQHARKEWLRVRNEADKLLDTYKKEKRDFYKKGLVVK